MPVTRTLKEAFDFFGARAVNPRWAWAAQSEDGNTVVLTMWREEMKEDGGAILYGSGPSKGAAWVRRNGNRDRSKKLQQVREHCGDLFRAVIIEASVTKAGTRSTRKKFLAADDLVMKLETFNPESGEFTARSVERNHA